MRRVLVGLLLGTLAAVPVAYVARRPLLQAIGGYLVVRDVPQRADAIVVLSGSLPDRILEAVDLYQAHLAPRIILTREHELPGLRALRARGATVPEHDEQNRAVAAQLGVPDSAIAVMPTRTSSTVAEAQALIAYLQQSQITSILLVTSKIHTRRAGLTFRTFAGNRLKITVCPSRYDPFAADTWWRHRAFVRRVVVEYGKLLNFLLIDRWRLRERLPASS
ncbi:MAG: YdcF family protein [Candidatus Binatia bacterium]